jgi:glycerol-3-phosphate acyltransferase PlsX
VVKKFVISVDAMGGANAPSSVIDGIVAASKRHKDVFFKIYGSDAEIAEKLKENGVPQQSFQFIFAPESISDDEQPVKALKRSRETSMRMAIEAVRDGEADGCISSGNTGALMVISKVVLGTIEGISRPAICSLFPNLKGGVVMLDLGANAECDEHNLFQFALMGHAYAKIALKKDNPTIGILNVGTEPHKGRDVEKKAYELISKSSLNFIGHVEGYDITHGNVDVAVTDGFSGNLVLKVAEGTAQICMDFMKQAFRSTFMAKIGGLLARRALKKTFSHIDHRNYNGAMLAGLNGVVVKSHGSSDGIAFANALHVAISLTRKRINKDIEALLKDFSGIDQPENLLTKIKHRLGF